MICRLLRYRKHFRCWVLVTDICGPTVFISSRNFAIQHFFRLNTTKTSTNIRKKNRNRKECKKTLETSKNSRYWDLYDSRKKLVTETYNMTVDLNYKIFTILVAMLGIITNFKAIRCITRNLGHRNHVTSLMMTDCILTLIGLILYMILCWFDRIHIVCVLLHSTIMTPYLGGQVIHAEIAATR